MNQLLEVLASKLQSQEFILAVIVLVLSAGLFIFSMKYVYKILVKRDEALRGLIEQILEMNKTLIKVASYQDQAHHTIIRTGDTLQEIKQCMITADNSIKSVQSSIQAWLQGRRDAK